MQCYRCGAELKDTAKVCNKCGFIMKGAKKIDHAERPLTLEERINNANEDELRAMLLAVTGLAGGKKKATDMADRTAKIGKRWANVSLISGIASVILMFIPGLNSIFAMILFFLAFAGFGKCAGFGSNKALIGLILTVVAIVGSWVYNTYAAPAIGKSLGFVKEAAENADQAADASAAAGDAAQQAADAATAAA